MVMERKFFRGFFYMKTVIIDQAHMTSTRLPGKVMKEVLSKPLLEYQIERLKRVNEADGLIIATTGNDSDQPIVELCERLGIAYYCGSEEDVLSRYYEAASEFGADIVVRVTSDCPLIDPAVMDRVIKLYKDNRDNYDYVSNTLTRSYPRGMDTEVFSYKVLKEAFINAKEKPEREHVTPYICWHPERYKLGNVQYHDDQSRHRWTVDQIEDFLLIESIIKALYPIKPHFNMEDVLNILKENPEWVDLNAGVEQKKI
jgi:spore coat polysaccharide biosynthesis protein SpsF